MEVQVPGGVLVIETQVNCLECQYLYRPNPDEDSFLCLRSLKLITHELDAPVVCGGFDELTVYWNPRYIESSGIYK